jgi:hypothetical protein
VCSHVSQPAPVVLAYRPASSSHHSNKVWTPPDICETQPLLKRGGGCVLTPGIYISVAGPTHVLWAGQWAELSQTCKVTPSVLTTTTLNRNALRSRNILAEAEPDHDEWCSIQIFCSGLHRFSMVRQKISIGPEP